MSTLIERDDLKLVKVGENDYRTYIYDGESWQKFRHHYADTETVDNYLIYSGQYTVIGTDNDGNLIIRYKK